uniref:Dynein axonemal light chain 1 n=1 Tax=Oreochromis niloticus TaxID=8128 RepID=A0A669C4G0_ORENI
MSAVCTGSTKEKQSGEKLSEAKVVKLYGQIPPIEKMDASLSTLTNCEQLSLSTNCIEKITNLNGLKKLKILSLGRNNIRLLTGLVSDTLEQLWISYNQLEKLNGIQWLKSLRVLYMSNKDWSEFMRLVELPCLDDLVFVGNPLEEKHSAEGTWMDEATKRLPGLRKLDGDCCDEEERRGEAGEARDRGSVQAAGGRGAGPRAPPGLLPTGQVWRRGPGESGARHRPLY